MRNFKPVRIVNILFAAVFVAMFVVSVADTNETRKSTNFNQQNILAHVGKLSENGPRSLVNKEANEKAVEYIVSQVESFGAVNEDTVAKPAYLVQDYVAADESDKYQNFYLKNVIVHIPANAGTVTGDAVMFMGHLDSVPMGQGASDDGVACATMLEAIRYYLDRMENGYTMKNDLVFCFVNGEEYDLYGSRAFMNEFTGFNDVVGRIRFGTNLESRGTKGTLITFETAKNNYNTIKLFSKVNESLFTCSIATMIYDMMPNMTDFTNFKEACQGLNMANIGGGEDYHTQNDAPENVGKSYLSQQAQIVDALIDTLSGYDLDRLYDADESAIFFSYLNLTTVVYNHAVVIVLAVLAIALLAANIMLSALYRRQNNVARTAKAIGAVAAGLIVSAGAAYLCYFVFQLIAALFGVINIHSLGSITYSNTAIVVGIVLLALSVCVLTAHFMRKWLKIERRDMTRAFAYIHAVLGIVLSFVLPDASYLFIFSGLLLLINEVLITAVRRTDLSACHGEVLATALYFPVVIPVLFLATSALGMTMAYVYGLVAALTLFAAGICLTPVCEYGSVRSVVRAVRKKDAKVSAAEGALHILAAAMLVFLVVSVIAPNANVNLEGKQSIPNLPYDDALVYVSDADGSGEYRIYDLNAYKALKAYAPEMKYNGTFYAAGGDVAVDRQVLSSADGNTLTIRKNTEDALVYLDFTDSTADSFTIDDGVTARTYSLRGKTAASVTIHSDCVVTVNGGSALVQYREVLRDYAALIPDSYTANEKLHFNLWLTADFRL